MAAKTKKSTNTSRNKTKRLDALPKSVQRRELRIFLRRIDSIIRSREGKPMDAIGDNVGEIR
jgi:phage-related protein